MSKSSHHHNLGESTSSNSVDAVPTTSSSSSLRLSDALASEMNRNNSNNLHASTSHHSHSHLGQQAVYMSDASEEHLMSNLTSPASNNEQTVLNLSNPAGLVSMLGDAMNNPNGPLQLTPQQQQELLQQMLQQQMGGGSDPAGGTPAGPPGPDQQQPPVPFVNVVIKALQSSLPFLIILVAKIFHQHLLGFFIVLGFMTTLHWSNRTLVNQVQLKEKKQNHKLCLLIVFLLLNVVVFFYIFKDYRLERCLIFLSPNIQKMDTWNLIWIVVCSDIIIKFIVISTKSMFILLPFKIMPLRKRGSLYSFVETLALFYRFLIPIHPWLLFLLYVEPNVSYVEDKINLKIADDFNKINTNHSNIFQIFLCVLYGIFKLNQIYNGLVELVEAGREFANDTTYGVPANIKIGDENICPICQDKYSNPVMLRCKHTFCQDCVCIWLDKENSCPMCRTKIAVKKPKFKDGSTSIMIQWF